VLLTALAFEAAYQTRVWLPAEFEFFLTPPIKALLLGTAIVAWLLIGNWFQLYERLDSAHMHVILRDTVRQCALGTICVVLLEYMLRLNLSRAFLGFFAAYSCVLLFLFRWKAGSIVGIIRREFGIPRYVMIVGVSEGAQRIGELIERSSAYGVHLKGFLSEYSLNSAESDQLSSRHPVYPIEKLSELLKSQVIDELIFAVDSRYLADLEEVFLLCDEEGVRTHVAVDFFPHVNSSVYLEHIGPAPLLTFSAAPHDEVRLLLKRSMDVVLAGAAFVLLLPFMAVVTLLIKLTSPGPVIFRQVRCGLNGRRFVCYKFRSMCVDAETMKSALEHMSDRRTAFKIFHDPRLTFVGRYLRKFSVDEWPQLWNVLKGEMSLVGPRPAVPEEVANYQRWQRRRLRMRPGLTCLWAINGRDQLDFETWMKLDMQYIDRWSLALDWMIIMRTIPHVLLGKGAH
jgi:exopolysaccharide biosynthesis polyprenyl glycosylphosphotransferase